MNSTFARGSILIGCLAVFTYAALATDAPVQRVAADKQALARLQEYVGGWRGVGQPRRGSTRDAWTEESDWAWHFAGGRAELVGTIEKGKFYSRLCLQAADKPDRFVLLATPVEGQPNDAPLRFEGALKDGVLELVTAQPAEGQPARISVRLVAAGDRMVVLYEKRQGADVYSRLAEVGSTRKGSSFAKAAASGPECVVTGGLGTIAVEYEGKKYFVCCTGCRDLFNDDPAGVLAEYRERKAAEKAKQAAE